jgi:hypothetical protein
MAAYINVEGSVPSWVGLQSAGITVFPETFINDPLHPLYNPFTVSDNGGYVAITASSGFDTPINVDDRIYYVPANSLTGYTATITAWDAATQTLTTDIVYSAATSSGAAVQLLYSPIISLFAGHFTGIDPYPQQLPYRLVDQFQVEWFLYSEDVTVAPAYVGQIILNGYLRTLFEAVQPANGGTNFTLFNKFRLIYDEVILAEANVAYSMLSDTDLSALAASNGYLTSYENTPAVFSCGDTILTKIDSTRIYEVVISNGTPETGDSFNSDFNTDYGY